MPRRISDLPEAVDLTDNSYMLTTDSNESKKFSFKLLYTKIKDLLNIKTIETDIAATEIAIQSVRSDVSSIENILSTKADSESVNAALELKASKQEVTTGLNTKANKATTLSGYGITDGQPSITGGASSITGSNLTANRALISNGSGKVAASSVTSTELGYLSGLTASVQGQLNAKSDQSHQHAGLYLPLSGGYMNGLLGMPNNVYIYGLNTYGVPETLIGHNSSDNIHAGATAGATNLYLHGNSVELCLTGGNAYPTDDAYSNLGKSSNRWARVYAQNAAISTSDRTKKKDIVPISGKYKELFTHFKPVCYRMIDGTSGRIHVGFISQDIEESLAEVDLSPMEFAGFCKDVRLVDVEWDEDGTPIKQEEVRDEDGNLVYDYSLAYEEFIALNTQMIQDCMARISLLERENEELKFKLSEIETKLK